MKPSIGYNLRLLRFQKNVTQSKVAEVIGISKNTLSRYENNERIPNEELLNKFADFYEVPVTKIKAE
ncbi:helix-turn-helix domain-containing protein [Bacillus nitroreducens]